jgi:ABC-type multidrug transport system ATPase subunit
MKSDLQKIKNSVTDVAFIHQDDQFFSMLTVEETLKLAAALRQQSAPKHTVASVASLVDDVMQALSLQHVASSTVGDPTKRGIHSIFTY